MNKKFYITSMLIFFFGSLLFAENPPTTYNMYDGFPPGSKSIAMGMAACAVSGDASSVYFNPSGLAKITSNIFSITYEVTRQSELSTAEIFSSEIIDNRNFIFLCLAGAKAAFTWRPLANCRIHEDNGNNWSDTELKMNMFTFSASHEHSAQLTSGLNISYLCGQIAESGIVNNTPYIHLSDGYGCSLDYGMLFTLAPELKIGINFQNLAGFVWWDNYEKEQLPFILRTGFAFQISQFMTFAGDWERKYYRKVDTKEIMHFGIEQQLGNILMLRCGIFGEDLNNSETTHVTAGLGYQNNGYNLSLALEKYKIDQKEVYRYILSMNIPIAS